MSYKLVFKSEAKSEWDKLDAPIKKQFKKKLAERLQEPLVPSAKLRGLDDCYKIKLRSSGFRLVYQVRNHALVVVVLAVGKRERNAVYHKASNRI